MKRRPTEAGQITAIATVAQSRGRVQVEVRQWRPQQGDRRSRNSRRRRRRRAGLTLSSGVDSGSGVERKRLGEEANPAALAQPAALTLATVATARRERRPRGRGGMDLGHGPSHLAAISTIVFFKHWQLCSQMGLFSNRLMLLISGAMLGFYVYRIASDFNKSEKVEQSSEA
ncbi:hypothetical protein ZIOFF_047653 [Zingiber officinale]|uniref:Uncharacterized protein n=1 Tax=Zingiber officinale TaxID=94328 RepID=A0A8J5FNC3_ZINOF|nr:hypothetical protein ZIOFF_047653 [Zingiber officinale]